LVLRAPRVFLGLGSNVGDRLGNLRSAVRLIDRHPEIAVTGVSSVYETEAIDEAAGQRDFYNAVAEIRTGLAALHLLAVCKEIERELGREGSAVRHAPRPIDIDLLLFGDVQIAEDDLVIPHPSLERRRFVLVPLLELAPDLPYADALATLGDGQRVAPVGSLTG
jgi:2-amino-4-hydroxy-6-hydroxymethyldihydropteridine diphosphokinase